MTMGNVPGRMLFVFFLLPMFVGGLAAATSQTRASQRLGWFLVVGTVVGLAYANLPWGEPLPQDQRVPAIGFVFLLPMVSSWGFLTLRAKMAEILRFTDSGLGTVILGLMCFLLSVFVFVGLGMHYGMLRLDDTFPA